LRRPLEDAGISGRVQEFGGDAVAPVQRLRSLTHFSIIETTSSGLLIIGT
jgi:hypothetical protein